MDSYTIRFEERDWFEEELKKIGEAKKRIWDAHADCGGYGTVGENECLCVTAFKRCMDLMWSRIPARYEQVKVVTGITEDLDPALGYCFTGPSGVGKTAMLAEMARARCGFYLKASEAEDWYSSRGERQERLLARLRASRVVCVDDWDLADFSALRLLVNDLKAVRDDGGRIYGASSGLAPPGVYDDSMQLEDVRVVEVDVYSKEYLRIWD